MSERDHQIDAAWRTASVEEPPAALDDALRAAARREVGAGPRRSHVPRWFPLAAAATVAVLVIGIVQLAPRDQVTDATHISTAPVSEYAAAPAASRAKVVAGPEKTQPTREIASVPPVAARVPHTESGAPQAAAKPAPPTPIRDEPTLKKEEASRRRAEPQDKTEASVYSDRLANADPALRAGSAIDNRKYAAAPAAAAAASPSAPPSMAAAPPPMPAQTPMTGGAPPRAFPASPADSTTLKNDIDAARNAANVPARSFGALESTPSQKGTARQDAKVAVAKDASARSVDEWVALIRRLRADGNIADAAKELAAFHDTFKERAESLLPADLRQTKQ